MAALMLGWTCGNASAAEVVSFPSGALVLQGEVYVPKGRGPFPAVLYNHGSAPGMLSKQAFDALGPVFAERGWVFSVRIDGAKV